MEASHPLGPETFDSLHALRLVARSKAFELVDAHVANLRKMGFNSLVSGSLMRIMCT